MRRKEFARDLIWELAGSALIAAAMYNFHCMPHSL